MSHYRRFLSHQILLKALFFAAAPLGLDQDLAPSIKTKTLTDAGTDRAAIKAATRALTQLSAACWLI